MSADFEQLAQAWEQHREARKASSNPFALIDHPAFEAIVKLGRPAVPKIIEKYREGSLFWGAALAKILGKTDFGDGLTGDLAETRRRWLSWFDAPQS